MPQSGATLSTFLWCGKLAGFGCRVYPSGRKVFVAQIRIGRAQRRVKIGPYGALTVEQARERAEHIIRAAADGRDPQREKQEARHAITVAELCEEYLRAARAGLVATRFHRAKAPTTTLAFDEGRISRHIVPLIGSTPARDLRRVDVQRMADAIVAGKTATTIATKPRGKAVVTGGPVAAQRATGLLGGVLSWGQRRGFIPEGPNPAHGIESIAGKPKDRVLTAAELKALGRALRNGNSAAAAIIRLIALTGLRRDEARCLKWHEIDELGQSLRLDDSKTGRSVRPVGKVAIALLRSLPRRDGVDWVFPRADGLAAVEIKKTVAALFDAAGLKDARPHDLRRTYASRAADLGFGDATVAELLGHSRRGVTERFYVRRSDPVLLAAADRVASQIAALLDGRESIEIVRLDRQVVPA